MCIELVFTNINIFYVKEKCISDNSFQCNLEREI